jgi:hypothetical protein
MSEWILLLVLFAIPIAFFALYPALLRYERRRQDSWLKERTSKQEELDQP